MTGFKKNTLEEELGLDILERPNRDGMETYRGGLMNRNIDKRELELNLPGRKKKGNIRRRRKRMKYCIKAP